jgi:hypothetical protein
MCGISPNRLADTDLEDISSHVAMLPSSYTNSPSNAAGLQSPSYVPVFPILAGSLVTLVVGGVTLYGISDSKKSDAAKEPRAPSKASALDSDTVHPPATAVNALPPALIPQPLSDPVPPITPPQPAPAPLPIPSPPSGSAINPPPPPINDSTEEDDDEDEDEDFFDAEPHLAAEEVESAPMPPFPDFHQAHGGSVTPPNEPLPALPDEDLPPSPPDTQTHETHEAEEPHEDDETFEDAVEYMSDAGSTEGVTHAESTEGVMHIIRP